MAKIGDVWDSTTDALAGRAGLLVPIAALAFALPSIVQSAVRLYGGPSPGIAALGALIGLIGLVVGLWGQLTVIAVASDPAATRAEAGRAALARLPALLLVVLVLIAGGLVAMMPILIALAATGYDFAAAAAYNGVGSRPAAPPGAALFVFFYALVLLVAGLWLLARLFLTNVVVLRERRGIGAIGRSVALTRGMTLKLIGTVLLFLVVYGVALLAVQSVVGLVFRLLLGPAQAATALFLAAIAGAALTAGFIVVVQVFAARLYAAVVGDRTAA